MLTSENNQVIGEYINVPGAYWRGRMSAAEKETLYRCVVLRRHNCSRECCVRELGCVFDLGVSLAPVCVIKIGVSQPLSTSRVPAS